jgi:uncharacterized membrane protein YccF (DUF307 family)
VIRSVFTGALRKAPKELFRILLRSFSITLLLLRLLLVLMERMLTRFCFTFLFRMSLAVVPFGAEKVRRDNLAQIDQVFVETARFVVTPKRELFLTFPLLTFCMLLFKSLALHLNGGDMAVQ